MAPATHYPPPPVSAAQRESDQRAFRWMAMAYLGVGTTLVFVLGVAIWGVYHDLSQVRATFLTSEMNRLRTHASRTAGLIQDELHQHKAESLADLKNDEFLRKHWERVVKSDRSRLYAAVVDMNGRVIRHSDLAREGGTLEAAWYDRIISEAGDDVVETRSQALAGGEAGYGVSSPLYVNNKLIGNYHSGLRKDWVDRSLIERQAPSKRVWAYLLTLIGLIVAISGGSLFFISRRMVMLHESVKLTRTRRFAELGQLMAGIVHEIRNPLNAMRLNLHVLSRQEAAGASNTTVNRAEHAEIIRETNYEIERVEGLLRILLGYARPDNPRNENLDVRSEVQATLTFLRPLLERAEILVKATFPEQPALVVMDRDRFRQILLNLINNSREAMDVGGCIQIQVKPVGDRVEIVVADDGPGIPHSLRERIFEPFFSTKELGTGLGLAIVRRFVEEGGGSIVCETKQESGALFRLKFVASHSDVTSQTAAIAPPIK
jgi:signal transduction histidine kinase